MFKILSYTKGWNGVFEVVITFDSKKEYTYFITSEYAHRKLVNYTRKGMFRKAIRILKDFNRKEMFIESINTESVPQGNNELCETN
jgi:hypothetical protein